MKKQKQLTCENCAYFNKGLNIDLDSCGLGEDYCNRDCAACCLFEDCEGLEIDDM